MKKVVITVKVHKELKKAEVENLFNYPDVKFEVKRRTIFATKEVSNYEEELGFRFYIEDYIFETMNDFYLEKCHAIEAEHERRWLAEQEKENKKIQKEKDKLKLPYEEFYENVATVREQTHLFSNLFTGSQYRVVEVYSADIFLYFLFGVLEECDLEPLWYKGNIKFKNTFEFDGQGFEDTIGFLCIEEAKQRLNDFFGEREEREAKFSMLRNNEELFKNIYDLDY